jgi:hypothetical protein
MFFAVFICVVLECLETERVDPAPAHNIHGKVGCEDGSVKKQHLQRIVTHGEFFGIVEKRHPPYLVQGLEGVEHLGDSAGMVVVVPEDAVEAQRGWETFYNVLLPPRVLKARHPIRVEIVPQQHTEIELVPEVV